MILVTIARDKKDYMLNVNSISSSLSLSHLRQGDDVDALLLGEVIIETKTLILQRSADFSGKGNHG